MKECARCGLSFPEHAPDKLLCLGCDKAWIEVGCPEDELPPMSEDHWRQIKPRRRGKAQ